MVRSKYYSTILLQILAVSVIPALIVGMAVTIRLYGYIVQRMEQVERLALQQTVSRAEEPLKSVRHSMLQFLTNADTLKAFRAENLVDDPQLVSRLRSNTSGLMFTSFSGLKIESVRVVNLRHGWFLDTVTGYRENLEGVSFPEPENMDGWSVALNAADTGGQKRYTLSCYANYLNHGLVVVNLPYDEFIGSLQLHNSISRLYVTDSEGRMVFDGVSEHIGQPAAFSVEEAGEELRFEMDGTGYKAIRLQSGNLGWSYFSVREDSLVRSELPAVMTAVFVISFVILALAAVVVSRLTQKICKPVQTLSRRLDEVVHPSVSGETRRMDELKRIEHSVNALIGSNAQLEQALRDQHSLTRELVMYRLFTGHIYSDSDKSLLAYYGIKIPWENKSLIGIRPLEDIQKGEGDDIFYVGAHRIASDLLPNGSLMAPTLINGMFVMIIGRDGPDFQSFAQESAYRLHEKITESLGIKARLALSSCVNSDQVHHISLELEKIRRILSLRQRDGGDVVILAENTGFHYPYHASEKLVTSLKLGNREEVSASLDVFLRAVYAVGSDLENQQMCMVWLVGDILKLAPDYSGYILNQAASSQHEDLIQTLSSIESVAEKKAWLSRHIIEPVANILHTDDANKLYLVNRMLSFIREHPQSADDIEACATALNYNASYLRKVFKHKMGVSFSQYASNYVLERAKEALRSSDAPVNAIAQELGFSNAQNFIRCFKKEFGVTPGQFRINQRNLQY